MKRLLLCLLLSFALLLTACSAPTPEPEAPEAPAPVEAEIPESPAPVEPTAPEPEPAPESNLIGISFPTEDFRPSAHTQYSWKQHGELMIEHLNALGYEVDLEFAMNDVSTQINQIDTMIENGARVLIIGAIDDEALRAVLDKARRADVQVIAYNRIIYGSDALSYYCTFDNWAVGLAQGRYIVDALDLKHADGRTYNLELFAGDPGDGNALRFFYDSAMQVLQPYIDNGTLIVRSGQIEKMDVATPEWAADKASERMEHILAEFYSDGEPLDAVMCNNDSTAQGVAMALESGYRGDVYPVITGQDCDIVSVMNIIAGKQAMSAFELSDDLAATAAEMANALMKGEEPPVNDTETYDNGTGIIPTYMVAPRVVTIDNYREILIDTGYYTEEQLAGVGIETE